VGCSGYWSDRSRDSSLLHSDRSNSATASRAIVEEDEDEEDDEEEAALLVRAPR